MSEENSEGITSETQITFNIKSSSDQKHVVTVPETMTVLELKQKLSTSEYADVGPGRQRLIYSGRVLKDPDPLSSYKIKDGNTIHMVKSAASNQRQNPANDSSSSEGGSTSTGIPGVPQNFATGTGTDPLAGLTGARYAGFAQMPGAETFGPDGMGMGQNPEDLLRMLDNPMFQSQMNEAMNNPHVIQMMQNHPMMRNNPMLQQMLQNPEMRRMMMDPRMIRQSIAVQRAMGQGGIGGRNGGGSGMPAPGVTDTTPANNSDEPQNQLPAPNPFIIMPGGMDMGGAGEGNPFAALFGPGFNPQATATSPLPTNPTFPPPTTTNATTDASATTNQTTNTEGQQPPQQQANPLAAIFGMPPAQGGGAQANPFAAAAQQLMQNPQMMQAAMQAMGGMQGGTGQEAGTDAFNPFGAFGGMGGMGGMGGGMGMGMGGAGSPPAAAAAAADARPPEEQYAEQLRQLNEMGFYEFDRNVRALRMAGGNVQGAVDFLLGGM